jgi:hypothetical protein
MLARCMDVRRRRIAVIVVGCALALATLPAVLADSSPAPSVPAVTSTAPDYAPSAAGEQFAAQVLASAPLPPGAQEWTAPPPADLDSVQTVGISGLIDLHELYLVGEPATSDGSGSLDRYALAHLPPRSSLASGNSGGGPQGMTSGFSVSLPTSGPNEDWAQILYETTNAPAGGYVLRVDAQVVWVPDRSPADAIPAPAGAQVTGYTAISAMNSSTGPVTAQLGEADGARLAAAVNALPLAPGTFCMEDSLLFTITFQPPPFSSSPSYSVSEDLCGATVYVSVGATHLPALSDTGCSLRHLVAGLLPARAAGTRSAAADC